ncbi:SMP-30/gluconolactonase/LRE family protein [Sphingomonas sp. S-NIH.Pt15_0812]|uniref:SMP-30/gluconolactonase/LRE family protein n=1 Tax=Sphingomonas sp. S-NIH.Pt15_0812 TaxID=1920129 RepID=UPI000F7EAB92|nr:SMP-30/gluconolactonase/LRE family protein [Sphingomonas sp. S-NIH.Pt15_0812]RSU48602.1 SMP-30/gluconolactonase/LRE family protein [Sphingomonas sp. S-NIH.Pt15_0812]
MTVRNVWSLGATLGEGPVWDARDAALWFVDIKQHRVHRFDPAGGETRSFDAPGQVGWVLPAADGGFLAGLQTGLHRFDPKSGAFTLLTAVEPDRPGNRLNDATVAADGAVWFGSMDDGETDVTGQVYRFHAGTLTTSTIPPVVITNGPAVSPDGGTLYHVDTLGHTIHAVPVDGATTGTPRPFATIDAADGYPDGVTVDAEGGVWVGLWGGWSARRYAPDGTLDRIVRFPVANITKVAFGGDDLRTGFATSASKGLSDEDRAAQPEAGSLFAFDVDVPGRVLPLARIEG